MSIMELERFTEQEIPVEKLSNFGITKEMIEDLPVQVKERLLAGRETPLMPIITENVDGEKVMSQARFSLIRVNNGTVDFLFSPRWKANDLEEFTPSQKRTLKAGKVTIGDVEGKGLCFLQFDDSIQQVMSVPVGVIRQNISILQQELNLPENITKDVAKGEVVEITDDKGNITSLGVDLEQVTGLRAANGNIQTWEKEAGIISLPKYSFGMYGCWVTDENNNMSYVTEDNMTEEMRQLRNSSNDKSQQKGKTI